MGSRGSDAQVAQALEEARDVLGSLRVASGADVGWLEYREGRAVIVLSVQQALAVRDALLGMREGK